ncbi:CRISPR-associated RecB family exonuclease Cas4a [Lachnospiraceae bacterium TWA4]|nr:CRISPR-associated RecB family exonuclease Cas4a [Lachnospiraceae bacterium TWA4]
MYVTGTLVWYYCICKREVWLLAHQIVPDQTNEDIDFGRFLHEQTYKRKQKEISFGNIRFDVILDNKDELVIGETKKSSHFSEASKWQLMFYLQVLKKAGINASGVLLYPQEKRREKVELNLENEKSLEKIKEEIIKLAEASFPIEFNIVNIVKSVHMRNIVGLRSRKEKY